MELSKFVKTLIISSSISLIATIAAYADTTGVVIQDNASVYTSVNDEIVSIGTLDINEPVMVIGEEDHWFKVNSKTFTNVYLPREFVSFDKVVVTGDSVNIRKQPTLNGEVVTQVDKSASLSFTAKVGEWYEVDYNGQPAYISNQFVKGGSLDALPEKVVEVVELSAPASNEELGQQIVAYAKQFLGTPYVYGGTNLNSGVDCSGFTSSVLKHFGIYVSRTSTSQANDGVRIKKSELQPGDLVFFNTGGNSRISHVGLYIGDNKIIHSASARSGGVIISDLNQAYYRNTYVTATRVI